MTRRRARGRVLVGMGLLLGLAAFPRSAVADEVEACATAYEEGQRLWQDGKLRSARAELIACARDVCPQVVRSDCGKWLSEVESKIPGVIVTAHDGSGDVDAARLFVDGEVVAEQLDGRPVALDPGAHLLRVETSTGSAEQRVVLSEGEKDRRVTFDLAASSAPDGVTPPAGRQSAPESRSSAVPTASWILGGVAVASVAGFVGFGLAGKAKEDCVPSCSRAEVDGFRRDYLIADVALGVAVVSAGLALWFLLREDRGPKPAQGATHTLFWQFP